MLRFNVYYTNYKANDEWFRKLKHRVESVIDGTSGVRERSRVMCVTDFTRPLYVKMSDEVEQDPYNSKDYWLMFAINPDFKSYREVCHFVTRVVFAIRSCQPEQFDMNGRPKMEYRASTGSDRWVYITNYTDIDLLAARLQNKSNATFSYNAMKRTEEMLDMFDISDFECYYKFPQWAENRGQEEWCRMKMEAIVKNPSSFGMISNNLYDRIQHEPFRIFSWGRKDSEGTTELFLCPDDDTLKQMSTYDRQYSLIPARGECHLDSLRKQIKKQLADKDFHVDQQVMFTFPNANGRHFLYLRLKENGIGVVVYSTKRYRGDASAEELWEFVSYNAEEIQDE